jgi:DNA-binding transcriptional LysR family regulator
MDRIAAMSAFVRVVEAGTFTKAAETLDLPPASVTRLIQWLEGELKVRLLHRTTRAVTVSPEGAIYYERVVRLLGELADIESGTRGAQAKPSGRVRVEVGTAMATNVIIPALPGFYARFPDVTVEMSVGNRAAELVADGVDCAIRMGEVTDTSVVARRVGDFRFASCATRAFLDAHGVPSHPDDVSSLPTIGMASARTGKPLPFRFAKGDEVLEITPAHRLVANDTNAYVAAGLAGLGLIHAPNYSVLPQLRSGELVAVLEAWAPAPQAVNVAYPPNRYLSAKVRVFIDWVIALFEEHPQLKRVP